MAVNENVNKVVYGNNTLIDLTSDTVEPSVLVTGYTAHDRSGAVVTGTLDVYNKSEVDDLLDEKQDILTFDSTPTNGSTNPVTSDGVYDAIQQSTSEKVSKAGDTMTGNLRIKPASGAGSLILYHGERSNNVGSIYGTVSSSGKGRVGVSERASNSDSDPEYFVFPNPTSPGSVWELLSTKNVVTVSQGGTGANNAADARTNLGIQRGIVGDTGVSVAAGTYGDHSVTFASAFASVPVVVVSNVAATTAVSMENGKINYAVVSRSTTGFTARMFNNASISRAFSFSWIAIG